MILSAADRPIATMGQRTVVSGGQTLAAMGVSSKPMIDRSSGTDRPMLRAACKTPAAISSLLAKIAPGRGDAVVGRQAVNAALERAAPDVQPELRMTLTQTSPLALAQNLLAGAKPAVGIQGDVQLAAEVAWLVDNVRWDVEEDLSRLVGDAMAHTLAGVAGSSAAALKAFLARLPARFTPSAHPSSAAPPASGATTGTSGSHGEGGPAA